MSGGQVGLDVGARGAAHALHAGRVAVRLLVVQVAPEQELHLLGRQRAVRRALKERARALAVALADLLRATSETQVGPGLGGEADSMKRWAVGCSTRPHMCAQSLTASVHDHQVDMRLACATSRLLARSGSQAEALGARPSSLRPTLQSPNQVEVP